MEYWEALDEKVTYFSSVIWRQQGELTFSAGSVRVVAACGNGIAASFPKQRSLCQNWVCLRVRRVHVHPNRVPA